MVLTLSGGSGIPFGNMTATKDVLLRKVNYTQKSATISDFWYSATPLESRFWIPILEGCVALTWRHWKEQNIPLNTNIVLPPGRKATGTHWSSREMLQPASWKFPLITLKLNKHRLSVKILTALAASSSFCFFSKTSSSALSFSNSFWQRFNSSFRKFTVFPGLSAMGTFSCIQMGKCKSSKII